MPQPPVTGLAPGDSIAFLISGIDVNELPGLAMITVYERTDVPRQALLSVSKMPPGLAITRFTASPVQVAPNQQSTLAWQTTGADSVTLSCQGESKIYPAIGQCDIRPERTTLYTLTATGSGTYTYQQLTVYVPEVRIVSFGATPARVPQGGAAILQWRIINASHAYIEPGYQEVNPQRGQQLVMPSVPTGYSLVATDKGDDTVSMPAFVNVMDVVVDGFTVTPTQIPPDAVLPARLAWSSQWATSCAISPGIDKEIPASGQANVTPVKTTTYTLTAQGYHPVTRHATVTVAPAIELFQIQWPAAGLPMLSWNVVGGDVTLSSNGCTTPVPASGINYYFPPAKPGSSALAWMTVTGCGLSTVIRVLLPVPPYSKFGLNCLTAQCDYGINATSATGKLSWRTSAPQVSGKVTAATVIPLTGSDGDLDVQYPASRSSEGLLWSMDLIYGPQSGDRVSWWVLSCTAG